ncbi:chaperonin-like RbcX protein 2, chloroplastic [Zingiber officinale]|nr:chaperonin-like RbcX protein 2, chloroplastic [Zingiber officinale]
MAAGSVAFAGLEVALRPAPPCRRPPIQLGSSFLHSRRPWRRRRLPALAKKSQQQQKGSRRKGDLLVVVDELGGQYEEGFEDVHSQLINFFTYKATRTVLHQLYEMNPPSYMWLYNFLVNNNPTDGKRFLRILAKEKQDLAERVMITRLHLYGKWIKKCDHAKMYQRISDENLQLMRERLMETVVWPKDDPNMEETGNL